MVLACHIELLISLYYILFSFEIWWSSVLETVSNKLLLVIGVNWIYLELF